MIVWRNARIVYHQFWGYEIESKVGNFYAHNNDPSGRANRQGSQVSEVARGIGREDINADENAAPTQDDEISSQTSSLAAPLVALSQTTVFGLIPAPRGLEIFKRPFIPFLIHK